MKKYIVKIEANVEANMDIDELEEQLIIVLQGEKADYITIGSQDFNVVDYISTTVTPDIDSFLERESIIVMFDGQIQSFDWEMGNDKDVIEKYLEEQGIPKGFPYVLLKNRDIDIVDETIKATKGELDYIN